MLKYSPDQLMSQKGNRVAKGCYSGDDAGSHDPMDCFLTLSKNTDQLGVDRNRVTKWLVIMSGQCVSWPASPFKTGKAFITS